MAKTVLEMLEIGLIRKLNAGLLSINGGPLEEITVADFNSAEELVNAIIGHAETRPNMPCGLLSIPSESIINDPNPAGAVQRITTDMTYRLACVSGTRAGLHDRKIFAYQCRDLALSALAQQQFQPGEWPVDWAIDYIRPTDSSMVSLPEFVAWVLTFNVKIRGLCTEVD
jgi:hypothetical protein